jgi:hypothetical protein
MFRRFLKKGQPQTNSPTSSSNPVEAGGAQGETSIKADLLATERNNDEAFGLKLLVAGEDPRVE